MGKKLFVVSLGCTKNLVDTEVMLGRLKDYSITDRVEEAEVIIVNTCGFIEAAKQESIQTIFDLHSRRKRDSILVMAGCLSERYKEELKQELQEVDLFTGVGDYDRIDRLLAEKKDLFKEETYLIDNEERIITGSKHHAYIKISEGCNQRCSFCAIPSFKGRLKSRTVDSVIDEISRLSEEGFYDFTLISQDTSSYLKDRGEREGLIRLIERIDEKFPLKSGRILYLYPATTDHKLIDTIRDSKSFHNYFEMPIQHISDKMLKIMKRGADADRTKDLLYRMREIEDSFVRTGVIVGHPGESEKDFQELCDFLQEFGFDRINVFAYSPEEGTASYEMGETVEPKIVQERLEIMEKIAKESMYKSLDSEIGKKIEIFLEGQSEEGPYLLSARKSSWAPEIDSEILINDSEIENLETGKLYIAQITERVGDKLIGRILSNG